MPITASNPLKGRHYPGEVILLVAEILGERGVEVDASCIWRWVQAYAPELDKRCPI
jgi:transposase-like protein